MSTLHDLEREGRIDLASEDYWAQARLGILREWIDRRHPDSVVDLGCGSGYLTAAIDAPQRDVRGIDIDADLIDLARSRETDASFSVGDARDLDLSNDSADVVVLADVIEHFDDPVPVLSEAQRVCRPDGAVLLSVPANPWLYGPHDERQGHARRYTPERLGEHAAEADLAVLRTRYTNAAPLLPYAVTQRVLKRDVPASLRGGRSEGVLATVKRWLLRAEHAVEWPVGVTLLAECVPTDQPDESVVLVNYEYPPECGGGGVFTRDLARELRERGAAAHLVVGDTHSARAPSGLLGLTAFPFRSFGRLSSICAAAAPECINGHFSLPSSLLLPLIKRRHDIPYVVSVMGADVHDPTRYRRIRPIMDAVNDRWVFQHADAITVASEDMHERVPARHRHKTFVLPYFVDTDRYAPGESFGQAHDPFRLLTVARLVPRKNVAAGIRAVERLWADGHPVTYTVVGSGSRLEPLRAMVRERGLEGIVEFTGYVPDGELVDVYRAHDCFVLTSIHEGFGIVLLEAMACGLPAVALENGGPRDVITSASGRVVETPDDIPAAVREIEWDYARLSRGARERAVANYSIPTVIEQYRNIFEAVS